MNGNGNAYVAGWTESSDFPTTPGAFDPTFNGTYPYSGDAFAVKLSPTGDSLAYATFLGGSNWDQGYTIAVDEAGNAIVAGRTGSSNFPTTSRAFDPSFNASWDAFVATLNPLGSGLNYSTFLGGWSDDGVSGIAVGEADHVYVTGATYSNNFPNTPGAYDPYYNGDSDAFVVQLSTSKPSTAALWTHQPLTIDGHFEDWGRQSPLLLNRDAAFYIDTQPPGSPPPISTDNSAELSALWTSTDLYFAIFVRDDAIVNDSTDVWRDDEIELAFVGAWDGNPAGGDTHQYTVNPDGRITDFGQANPPIQAAALPVAGGWNVEVRIPAVHLFGLNAPLTAGKTMAFDLGLHDDDDGGNWDSHMIWASNSTSHNAGGLLRLDDVVAPTPLPTSTPTSTPTAYIDANPHRHADGHRQPGRQRRHERRLRRDHRHGYGHDQRQPSRRHRRQLVHHRYLPLILRR